MLRWFTGSFVPSKASTYDILNFVGREKCSTPAMNEDSFCCTGVSMETRARTFYSHLHVAELLLDVLEPLLPRLFSLPLLIRGWLITSFIPTRHSLITTISGGYVGIIPPSSAVFSSSINVSGGANVFLFLLWIGIAAFPDLLCLL